nr:immunoglobulin heavy chain junction region [Macaca mulatta]MOY21366.1 immunoglobulin heavy chain junction region [Macaca mulatta]MOY21612.1 immunoglobulin heavy chain junction region [Macaca mulatta]MOY21627.1 immunoglobulin heavy chain junction region [Macaca mulatta]MOY21793.1 immunoglobulin heavy chain junction region [Macaca mulatta]
CARLPPYSLRAVAGGLDFDYW